MSQAAFGAELGLSDRAYKNYELGIRDLPLAVALGISEKYDANIAWLLTGDGARSGLKIRDALKAAVIAVREHFIAEGETPSPDYESDVVQYVFDEILREGGLNSSRIDAYFKTLRKDQK
jgi:transcriptional regulator with XRE-family HTH domain